MPSLPERYSCTCRVGALALMCAVAPAMAQVPQGWNQAERLGQGVEGSSWMGAGVWGAHQSGPPATLINSLGLGNSLVGSGVSLEGGFRSGSWEGAARILLFHDADGASRGTLHQGHLTWSSEGGWRAGFEHEPLVWGYGLNGGYLLGEAARPFPRLQLTTPPGHFEWFGTSLGTWTGQTFVGRLEARRRLADNMQNPSAQSRLVESGEPEAPFFSGYRVAGSFLEGRMESYLNWTVLWGGTRNGVAMTRGYGFSDYLTAMTGTKDLAAESSIDFSDPNHPAAQYANQGRSSTNFEFGIRGKVAPLARWMNADESWVYWGRGSKSMLWPIGVVARRPLYWLGKDLELVTRQALQLRFGALWTQNALHVVPNLLTPNDALGILLQWPKVRLGLERRSTTILAEYGYRSFQNGIYATGFYRDGDPLGEAFGGETAATTVRVEWDARPDLTSTFWFYRGARPFRDDPTLWRLDHPGQTYREDYFTGLQAAVAWRPTARHALRLGASLEHHTAPGYQQGRAATGARYFLEWSTRWSNPIR